MILHNLYINIRVCYTLGEPKTLKKTVNSSIPSSQSLFQSIQGFLEFVDMGFFPMDHKTLRMLDIGLFLNFIINKSSLDIHLVKFPIKNWSKRDDDSNRGIPGNRSKDLVIINSFFLREATSHKSSFEFFNTAICCMLYFVNPFRSHS